MVGPALQNSRNQVFNYEIEGIALTEKKNRTKTGGKKYPFPLFLGCLLSISAFYQNNYLAKNTLFLPAFLASYNAESADSNKLLISSTESGYVATPMEIVIFIV